MRPFLPLAVIAAAAAIAASPAAAAPSVAREFDVPGQPGQLTLGPDGNAWVVLSSGTADIARVAPDGAVTSYRDARLNSAKSIVTGPDGRLWMTRSNEIVSFSPADPVGTATAIAAPVLTSPQRIVTDDAGVLWTASGENVVSVTAGVVRSFRVTGLDARGIAFGGDRRLWIASFGTGQVVATPRDGGAPEFFAVGGGPQEVAAGPGTQVAYTNQGATPHEIGRIDAPTVARLVVDRTDPFGITRGLDDAYWIANFTGHDITRLATDGSITRLGGFTPLSGPRWITSGAGGTLWVSLELTRRVALVTGIEAPRVDPPRVDPPRSDPPRTDPPRDLTKPVVGGLAISGRARAGARSLGIRFTLSERATVTVRLLTAASGKRRGSACVKPTRRLRRAHACTRWVQLASVSGSRPAGPLTATLRRGGGRTLPAGRYRVVVGARDGAGNVAVARTVSVRLTKR
ncbi:MAG TPA: hypothetical protein VLK58_06860 [Conexibacter sp.]|nr:hypothetical protein [Conexibacter sp.]